MLQTLSTHTHIHPSAHTPRQMKSPTVRNVFIFGALSVAVIAAVTAYRPAESVPVAREAGFIASSAPQSQVVAVVNGKSITEVDISEMLLSGADRAVAVDRAVNKAIAAELAQKVYAKDADSTLRAVERDVLSRVYISKRTDELRKSVSGSEIKAFYDKEIDTKSFSEYKVSAFITQDPAEANAIANQVASGKPGDASSRFSVISSQGSGSAFLKSQDLPFGLGQVVRQMKPGEYSKPLVVQSGIVILRLDEVKDGKKPDLTVVSDEIKDLIVAKRLNDELVAARQSAQISVK